MKSQSSYYGWLHFLVFVLDYAKLCKMYTVALDYAIIRVIMLQGHPIESPVWHEDVKSVLECVSQCRCQVANRDYDT